MVLLEELGLRVEVIVNDVAAEEFPSPAHTNAVEEDAKFHPFMCQKYIESEAGLEFFIAAEVLDSHSSLRDWIETSENNIVGFGVSVDGRYYTDWFLGRQTDNGDFEGSNDLTNNTIQKLQFAPITPIEDATKELEAMHKKQTKELGTIQVRVHRVVIIELAEKRQMDSEQNVFANSNPEECRPAQLDEIALAEKALKGKALVHGASLVPSSDLQPGQVAFKSVPKSMLVDPEERPFAVVKFMYRSKDALKQELIIPRTPSPEPRPSAEPQTVDDLSLREIRRLAQEKLSELQDRKRAARVKKDEDEATQPSRPFKYIRTAGGRKAIDLTEDG